MPADGTTTADRILDAAEEFWARGGYRAFSYHDVAAAVGIRTASIHYYFPTKADLAEAVLARVRARFNAALAGIDAQRGSWSGRLRGFVALFEATLGEAERLCPFCVAAVSIEDMGAPVRAQIQAFWRAAEGWLTAVIEAGHRDGEFAYAGSPAATAQAIVALVEGAMVAARGLNEPRRVRAVIEWLEANLQPAERAARPRSALVAKRLSGK
jgi:TetR/AcrR family transcriptional repressor of nem operon